MEKVAILVDGGFYRRRMISVNGYMPAIEFANQLFTYCCFHLKEVINGQDRFWDLYRIFYYDCPPLAKKVYHPLLKSSIDLSKTDDYKWMNEFLAELKKKRKTALRLGNLLEDEITYTLKKDVIKKLINGTLDIISLTQKDFVLDTIQKGVDMKIGIDIATLAHKKLVNKIILISGDSDFAPAAKLARIEGIDFILDPLWAKIKPDLYEHIDGLASKMKKPD
ncbi:MAG: NYN domain-containing protein [Deferribacteraceae bacterium]|nr:NYN domain-containing protein [Deferribacteraceae bacterium]